jgi:hypothetical protein
MVALFKELSPVVLPLLVTPRLCLRLGTLPGEMTKEKSIS